MKNFNLSALCIGAAHIDSKFMPINPLVKSTSNPISSDYNYGGVVRNVGENLSRLGIDVSLMSIVGNDLFGRQLIEEMSQIMNVEFVQQEDAQSTGQYYAVLNMDGDMDIAYADMSIYDLMNANWMMTQLNKVPNFDYYIVDMNVQKSGLNILIQWAETHGKKLIIIGVSEPKMRFLPDDLTGVYLLLCNLNEAKAYFNDMTLSHNDLVKAWKKSNLKNLIMTDSQNPITLVEDGQAIYYKDIKKVTPENIIDATGAGDAFSGGLIFGLMSKMTLKEALDYGAANARLTIQSKQSVRQDLNKEKLTREVKK